MIYVAYFCLALIFLACLAGLAWSGYDDNWAQNWGLVLLGIGVGFHIDQIARVGYVSWLSLLIYIALSLYLGGTAYKAWIYRPRNRIGELNGR